MIATRTIPRGTIVWARDPLDQALTKDQVLALPPPVSRLIETYGFDDGGETILCWDHARFVNHSCAPTCLGPWEFDFEIAIRDIQPGEQLTDDYGTLSLDTTFSCRCSEAGCRRLISPDDPFLMAERWDRMVEPAFLSIRDVPQPLWSLIPGENQETIRASASLRYEWTWSSQVARRGREHSTVNPINR